MEITNVRVYLRGGEDKLRAFASITIDGAFLVDGLKVFDGQKGLFVSMPSRKVPGGGYKDIAFPVTREAREALQEKVIGAYRDAVETSLVET